MSGKVGTLHPRGDVVPMDDISWDDLFVECPPGCFFSFSEAYALADAALRYGFEECATLREDLDAEAVATRVTHDEQATKLQRVIEERDEWIERARACPACTELDAARAARDALRDQVVQLVAQVDEARDDHGAALSGIETLRADVARLTQERDDARAEAAMRAKATRDAISDRDALRADLAAISTELDLPPTIGPARGEVGRMRRAAAERAMLTARLDASPTDADCERFSIEANRMSRDGYRQERIVRAIIMADRAATLAAIAPSQPAGLMPVAWVPGVGLVDVDTATRSAPVDDPHGTGPRCDDECPVCGPAMASEPAPGSFEDEAARAAQDGIPVSMRPPPMVPASATAQNLFGVAAVQADPTACGLHGRSAVRPDGVCIECARDLDAALGAMQLDAESSPVTREAPADLPTWEPVPTERTLALIVDRVRTLETTSADAERSLQNLRSLVIGDGSPTTHQGRLARLENDLAKAIGDGSTSTHAGRIAMVEGTLARVMDTVGKVRSAVGAATQTLATLERAVPEDASDMRSELLAQGRRIDALERSSPAIAARGLPPRILHGSIAELPRAEKPGSPPLGTQFYATDTGERHQLTFDAATQRPVWEVVARGRVRVDPMTKPGAEPRFLCTLCGVPSRYWNQRCPYCLQAGTLVQDPPVHPGAAKVGKVVSVETAPAVEALARRKPGRKPKSPVAAPAPADPPAPKALLEPSRYTFVDLIGRGKAAGPIAAAPTDTLESLAQEVAALGMPLESARTVITDEIKGRNTPASWSGVEGIPPELAARVDAFIALKRSAKRPKRAKYGARRR